MSESSRLRAFRACVNLPEAANGRVLLIDDSDDRWADRIRSGALVAVGPPADYVEPVEPITRETVSFDGVKFGDLPTDDEVGRALADDPGDADVLADAGLDTPVVDE